MALLSSDDEGNALGDECTVDFTETLVLRVAIGLVDELDSVVVDSFVDSLVDSLVDDDLLELVDSLTVDDFVDVDDVVVVRLVPSAPVPLVLLVLLALVVRVRVLAEPSGATRPELPEVDRWRAVGALVDVGPACSWLGLQAGSDGGSDRPGWNAT
jgi:hypothetical protein